MTVQTNNNFMLTSISHQNEEYKLQILSTSKTDLKFTYLRFVSRHSNDKLDITFEESKEVHRNFLLSAKISKEYLSAIITENQCWDLYIVINHEEQSNQFRLKTKDSSAPLPLYVDSKKEMVLLPYTTNKGNLSFNVKEIESMAIVEKSSLTKEGAASIGGYIIIPDKGETPSELNMTLIIQNEDLGIEEKIVNSINYESSYSKQGNHAICKFQFEFNVEDFFSYAEKSLILLEPYVEISYMKDNQEVGKSTPRNLYWNQKNEILSEKLNYLQNKKKVIIGKTNNNYLYISINEYRWSKDILIKVKNRLNRWKKSFLTQKLYKRIFALVGKLPAKKNLVVFESFLGKQYSDNPRAIYEYLKETHPEYKLVWSVDKRFIHNFKDKDIDYVNRFSIKWLFHMALAKYWVTNSRMPLWIPKPKHCTYLQTWHGTPLKKLAADMDEVHMPGTSTQRYKENFIKEASNWDFLVSPNEYSTKIFRRAFQFNKEMIESGYPRNDFLYKSNTSDTINMLKERYKIPLDKKLILYAPTWRDNQFYAVGKYKFDLDLDLRLLQEELGNEYVIILRMHYLVAENFDLSPYEGFVYDFSNHEDIRELYLISDLLITDYSSVFFDYANLKRPMIFYVYDIDMYRDTLRGFYFDFENQAPGPLVKTTEQVIETIKEIQLNDFRVSSAFNSFYEKFCYLESGQSSKRVVDKVFRGRNIT